jgi:hypothetical protein
MNMKRIFLSLTFFLALAMGAQAQIIKGAGVLYFDSLFNVNANTAGSELAYSIKLKKLYRWNRTLNQWVLLADDGNGIFSAANDGDTMRVEVAYLKPGNDFTLRDTSGTVLISFNENSTTMTAGNATVQAVKPLGYLLLQGDSVLISSAGSFGTAGQVLTASGDGGAFWENVGGTGTVTSVAAGVGITASPSPITSTGTISADTSLLASKTFVTTRGYLTTEVDGSITNEGFTGVTAGGASSSVLQGYNSAGTATGAGTTINVSGGGLSISESTSTNGGSITISSTALTAEVDGSISNEGSLTVGAGTATTSIINSNTSGSTGVTVEVAGTGIAISEVGNTITLTGSALTAEVDGSITNEGFTGVTAGTGTTSILQGYNSAGTATGAGTTFAAGTGMSIAESTSTNGGTITLTNSAPDQTVALTNGGGVAVSGTYPSFTLTATDASLTNEGSLTVAAGTATTSIINSNTSGSTGVTIEVAGTGIAISEVGNTITLTGSALTAEVDGSITNEGFTGVTAGGASSSVLQGYNSAGTATGIGTTINVSGGGLSIAESTSTNGGSITISSTALTAEVDASVTNEGSLTVAAGTGTTSIINSNTSGSTGVTIEVAGTGIAISESGNTITLTGSASGVTGTGTTGTIPVWSTSTALGDSPLTVASGNVTATGTGAFRLPNGTDAQRPGTPTAGMERYSTTNGTHEWYGASAWERGVRSANATGLGTVSRVPFYDANGRLTDNTNFRASLTAGAIVLSFGTGAGFGGTDNFFMGRSAGGSASGAGNNCYGAEAGFSLSTGFYNNLYGQGAGAFLTTGYQNNSIGEYAGPRNAAYNTTAIGRRAAFFSNSSESIFIGAQAGYRSQGLYNIVIGGYSVNSSDSLTGAFNTIIGTTTATGLSGSAAMNTIIGSQISPPSNTASNQLVISNVVFATGASGTGTTIEAGSKVGIKVAAPARDLHIAGEVRVTDLTTDTPTRIVGADADGDLGAITVGTGLSLSGGTLTATAGAAGVTNLAFSGASSPVTLTSDTGTDVIFAAGTGLALSQSGGTATYSRTYSLTHNTITGGSTFFGTTPERPDNDTPGSATTSAVGSDFSVSGSTIDYTGPGGALLRVAGTVSFSIADNVDVYISIFKEGTEIAATSTRTTCAAGNYYTVTLPSTTTAGATNDTFDVRIATATGTSTTTMHRYGFIIERVY